MCVPKRAGRNKKTPNGTQSESSKPKTPIGRTERSKPKTASRESLTQTAPTQSITQSSVLSRTSLQTQPTEEKPPTPVTKSKMNYFSKEHSKSKVVDVAKTPTTALLKLSVEVPVPPHVEQPPPLPPLPPPPPPKPVAAPNRPKKSVSCDKPIVAKVPAPRLNVRNPTAKGGTTKRRKPPVVPKKSSAKQPKSVKGDDTASIVYTVITEQFENAQAAPTSVDLKNAFKKGYGYFDEFESDEDEDNTLANVNYVIPEFVIPPLTCRPMEKDDPQFDFGERTQSSKSGKRAKGKMVVKPSVKQKAQTKKKK